MLLCVFYWPYTLPLNIKKPNPLVSLGYTDTCRSVVENLYMKLTKTKVRYENNEQMVEISGK